MIIACQYTIKCGYTVYKDYIKRLWWKSILKVSTLFSLDFMERVHWLRNNYEAWGRIAESHTIISKGAITVTAQNPMLFWKKVHFALWIHLNRGKFVNFNTRALIGLSRGNISTSVESSDFGISEIWQRWSSDHMNVNTFLHITLLAWPLPCFFLTFN